MATRTGIVMTSALGGSGLGTIAGGILGVRPGTITEMATLGGAFGLLAGLVTGAVAVSIGYAAAPHRVLLREGDLVAGWRIVRALAAYGPTGPAHLVRRHDQWGVMKSIHRADVQLGHRAEVLVAETRAAGAVRSEYVARFIEGGDVGERCYVVYQYAGDTNLERTVERGRRRPLRAGDEAAERALWDLAVTTATGLVDIHEARLVHQDLTPANICDRGSAGMILDLGMARVENVLLTSSSRGRLALEYSPPERQRAGYRAHPSSDVYQWAACILTAVTGERPYGGAQEEALVRLIAAGPPDTSAAPVWLRGLLVRCLATDPGSRPSATEVVQELATQGRGRGWDRTRTISIGPPPAWRRGRVPERRVAAVGAGIVIAGLLTCLAVIESPEDRLATPATTPGTTDRVTTTADTDPPDPPTTTTSAPSSTTTAPQPTTTLIEDVGWPTTANEGPAALYAMFGVEATEGFEIPDWTSCVDEYCIAGRGDEIYLYEGAQMLGTLDQEGKAPYQALVDAGFTDAQARDLLAP